MMLMILVDDLTRFSRPLEIFLLHSVKWVTCFDRTHLTVQESYPNNSRRLRFRIVTLGTSAAAQPPPIFFSFFLSLPFAPPLHLRRLSGSVAGLLVRLLARVSLVLAANFTTKRNAHHSTPASREEHQVQRNSDDDGNHNCPNSSYLIRLLRLRRHQ